MLEKKMSIRVTEQRLVNFVPFLILRKILNNNSKLIRRKLLNNHHENQYDK